METLERWLRERPLLISLLLALFLSYCFCTNGVVSEDAMPFGDGEHYVLRGMTLYGYLHSAQWSRFWDELTLPGQCLLLPHFVVFFLLPQAWASVTSYGIIQALTTNLILAVGAWLLCRALDRAEWAPALYLLCAAQNLALDESYFFFADQSFLAVGLVALAWQVRAWREGTLRSSLLSGAGLGLLFWIKPANALIFTATYAIAEAARILLIRRGAGDREAPAPRRTDLVRHVAGIFGGFIPVLALALACGGCKQIFVTLDLNEVSAFFSTKVEGPALLRFFYFPLCLTYFYHAFCLLVIFAMAGVAAFKLNRKSPASPAPAFPANQLLPLMVAYFIFGEFFSFGMGFKSMRFVLIILPVFWLSVFWALEHWRVRSRHVLVAAAAYTLCALGQILFNSFESGSVAAESYQLKDDWLWRFPPWHADAQGEIELTRGLLDLIHQTLPDGGKIAVGSEQLYVTSESLTWSAQHDLALRGQASPYEFANFLTYDGKLSRSALLGARGILVFVHPKLQYSREVYGATGALLQFVSASWMKDGTAQVAPLQSQTTGLIGYLVVMKEPMADAQITQLIAATNGVEVPPGVEFGVPADRRISWGECLGILKRWVEQRSGRSAP